jgi:hypothetical protein
MVAPAAQVGPDQTVTLSPHRVRMGPLQAVRVGPLLTVRITAEPDARICRGHGALLPPACRISLKVRRVDTRLRSTESPITLGEGCGPASSGKIISVKPASAVRCST